MVRVLSLCTLVLGACTLDRTGQSASEAYKREIALQGARVGNLETWHEQLEARISQLEDLNRARGQEEILRMETLDEVRGETAKLRGELEVIRHELDDVNTESTSQSEDAAFRMAWLESRAEALEKAMGIKPPAPPAKGAAGAEAGGTGGATAGAASTPAPEPAPDTTETDPASLIKLAEGHLAAGRAKAAEAVLDRFLSLYPKHERAPEAMYRRAEAAFNAKSYAQAVLRFQEVIDQHKKSPWASWAMLRQGECFDAQGQKENARLFYEDVVRLYPKTKAADDAKKKLKK
jgi:tol-pal system protein YbgF